MDTAMNNKWQQLVGYLKGLRLSWTTVAVMAVFLAFADGFVLLAFQGAVGAVERQSQPFQRWIVMSLLMVPFYAAAVVLAMILTRRWAGRLRRSWVKGGIAVLLIVATSVMLGAVLEAGNGVYDYSLQSRHIDLMVSTHTLHSGDSAFQPVEPASQKCDAGCRQKHDTIVTHIRSVFLAAKYMLLINLVLTVWLVAIRGGRLWAAPRRQRGTTSSASTPVRLPDITGQPALV
jgi:hypothetical protein